MFKVGQVLLLNSDLQILFGQQREAKIDLNFTRLTGNLSTILHSKEDEIFEFHDWQVGFKRLNSQCILVILAREVKDERDRMLFAAYLQDLQNIFQQLFPNSCTDYFQHTDTEAMQIAPGLVMLKGFGLLESRRLLRLDGLDAAKFLQGLTTNDIEKCATFPNSGQFTSFLNAQGRMMYDAFIFKTKDAFYIDCDAQSQEGLFLHLQTYNLRSKTSISMIPDNSDLSVAFSFNENRTLPSLAQLHDPRAVWEMQRFLVKTTEYKAFSESNSESLIREGRYNRERILAGVPEGPFEIAAQKAIPLEYNFDLMKAIDMHKGCYLGQELITRTLHRGVVRKRLFPLLFHYFNYESGEPEGFTGFDADSDLTENLDRQTEILATAIQGEATENDTFIIPKGKLRILNKNDPVGRLVSAHANIGLGLMRLDQLRVFQKNLALLDHIKQKWLLADVTIPAHLQSVLE